MKLMNRNHTVSYTVSYVDNRSQYYVLFRIDGKQVKRATGVKGKANAASERLANKAAKNIICDYIDELEENIHNESLKYNKNTLFCDHIMKVHKDRWAQVEIGKLRDNTLMNEEHYIRKHILPYFEALNLTVSQVKTHHLEEFYRVKSTTLSGTTIHQLSNIKNLTFKDLVKNDVISKNPNEFADKPPKQKPQYVIYSKEQLDTLYEMAKGTKTEPHVFLVKAFALRIEEVCGLLWSNIDFDNRLIHIHSTCSKAKVDGKNKWICRPLVKSSASWRSYLMNDAVYEYLSKLKEKQMSYVRITNDYIDNVSVDSIGQFINNEHAGKSLKRIQSKLENRKIEDDNGMKRITFHPIRHSALTIIQNECNDIYLTSKYAGHEGIDITVKTYANTDHSYYSKATDILTGKTGVE